MMIDILDYKIEKRKEMKEVKKEEAKEEVKKEAKEEVKLDERLKLRLMTVAETGVACQASVVTLNKECQTDHVVTTEYR